MSEGTFIKAAKNEYLLALFRASSTVFLAVITAYVVGTRDDVKAINKDLSDFKIAYAERVSHVEGQVGQLTGSVEAHRQRLNGDENDIRSLWGRLYELTARTIAPTQPRNP